MARNLDKILAHAVQNNLNILLKGKHGVGKTAMVQQCFEQAGLKWKYYSASTMDPWVDFIGVPKEKTDKDGNTYLDLVRPKDLACDEVEAIFFDELNRSHKKIRNAVMELIQFKSINGKKFKNLKIVWAAINPDDEEGTYDVEKLDPAQIDRFQIHLDVPNEPDSNYFKSKYETQGERAIKWWASLDKIAQSYVSPRRLDYALQILNTGGDVRCVLDHRCNVSQFIATMSKGDPLEICNKMLQQTPAEIQRYLMDNNNYKHVQTTLLGEERFLRGLARHIPREVLLKELMPKAGANNQKLVQHVTQNTEMFDAITDSILGSRSTYGDMLIKAFDAHKQRKVKNELNAVSMAKNMMSKLAGISKTPANGTIMLNGKVYNTNDLTLDNFEPKTGRRFRVTSVQNSKIMNGTMTREDAFNEFISNLARRANSNDEYSVYDQ